MTTFREAKHLISSVTQAEKAQVLQWIARDLGRAFSGIKGKPDTSDGELIRINHPA